MSFYIRSGLYFLKADGGWTVWHEKGRRFATREEAEAAIASIATRPFTEQPERAPEYVAIADDDPALRSGRAQ